MSTYQRRRERERKSNRNRTRRRVVWALVLAAVFAVGVALGQALEDNPRTGSTTTREQTFTVQPESATVTVTAP